MEQKNVITPVEKLVGELNGESTTIYVGKDEKDNLFKSTSATDVLQGDQNTWLPLSTDKYHELRNDLQAEPVSFISENTKGEGKNNVQESEFERDEDFADAISEYKDQTYVEPMFDPSNTAESVDRFVKDLENDTPTYEDKTVDKALNMSFDKEDIQQILELEKLRSENKELTEDQRNKILNNPNFSDEKKLVLLTFMNDKNPEKTITDHYASLSEKANKDVEMKTGRELHSSKDSSVKKTASKIANTIEKTSRFTVD